MSRPRTEPSPALSARSPASSRRRLVFPAPLAPTSTVSDDAGNIRSTPLRRGKSPDIETAPRRVTDDPSDVLTRLVGQGVDVRGHHHFDQSVEVDFAFPTQVFVRLGGVADQEVDLRGSDELGIDDHVLLVVQPRGVEGDLA